MSSGKVFVLEDPRVLQVPVLYHGPQVFVLGDPRGLQVPVLYHMGPQD